MDHTSVVYVGVDAAKAKHAVALAEGSRNGEVRYLGEIETSPASTPTYTTLLWSMVRPPLHEARLGPSEQPSSAHACKG